MKTAKYARDAPHCGECGMLLRDVGEYHPYEFCVLKKAGLAPWAVVQRFNRDLGLVPDDAMPTNPPMVRNMEIPA